MRSMEQGNYSSGRIMKLYKYLFSISDDEYCFQILVSDAQSENHDRKMKSKTDSCEDSLKQDFFIDQVIHDVKN